MKSLLALSTVFLWGSFTQTVFADSSNLVGTYEGTIWANSDEPGTTEFYLTTDQKIEGKYVFIDGVSGDEGKGLLNNCDLSGLVLHCIWNDEWGTGDFVIEFEEDFSSFAGQWFDEISEDGRDVTSQSGHTWDGVKQK